MISSNPSHRPVSRTSCANRFGHFPPSRPCTSLGWRCSWVASVSMPALGKRIVPSKSVTRVVERLFGLLERGICVIHQDLVIGQRPGAGPAARNIHQFVFARDYLHAGCFRRFSEASIGGKRPPAEKPRSPGASSSPSSGATLSPRTPGPPPASRRRSSPTTAPCRPSRPPFRRPTASPRALPG